MGYVPKSVLSASASPDGWPEKGRHIGGQKRKNRVPHALEVTKGADLCVWLSSSFPRVVNYTM